MGLSVQLQALGKESIPNPSPLGLRATEGLGNTSRYSLKSHRLSHRPPQLFCPLFSLPASVDSDQEEDEKDQAQYRGDASPPMCRA